MILEFNLVSRLQSIQVKFLELLGTIYNEDYLQLFDHDDFDLSCCENLDLERNFLLIFSEVK